MAHYILAFVLNQAFPNLRINYAVVVTLRQVVMLMVVLQVAWIGMTTVLSIPILLIAILHYQHKVKDTTCFNLKHYGQNPMMANSNLPN